MTYTYLSAQFANPEQTAATAITEEFGAVLVSISDKPDEWARLLKDVPDIAPYEAPVAPAAVDPIEAAKAFLLANPTIAAALGVKAA